MNVLDLLFEYYAKILNKHAKMRYINYINWDVLFVIIKKMPIKNMILKML